MYQQNNTPKPAQSFGSVQETFRYRLRAFNQGEQFSIVEDMPRSKPIRFEKETKKGRDGRDFESKTYLIRVVSRGYEADLEIYEKDLPGLAVLCPKGLENFKGATFVFDGNNWAYMGQETPQQPISSVSQAMAPTQPQDQRDEFLARVIKNIDLYTSLGSKADAAIVMKMCELITPGKALDLFQYAKTKGAIIETNGEYKTVK